MVKTSFFSDYLKFLRKSMDYTQSHMASILNISPTSYSRIESGRQLLKEDEFLVFMNNKVIIDKYGLFSPQMSFVQNIDRGLENILELFELKKLSENKSILINLLTSVPHHSYCFFKVQLLQTVLDLINGDSLKNYRKLLTLYSSSMSNLELALGYDLLSIDCSYHLDAIKEMEYINKAFNFAVTAGHKFLITIIIYHKIQCYTENGNYSEALLILENNINLLNELRSYKWELAVQNLLAMIYMNLRFFDKADFILNKILLHYESMQNEEGLSRAIENLAWNNVVRGQYKKGIDYIKQLKTTDYLSENGWILLPFSLYMTGALDKSLKSAIHILDNRNKYNLRSKTCYFLEGLYALIKENNKSFDRAYYKFLKAKSFDDHFMDEFFLILQLHFYRKNHMLNKENETLIKILDILGRSGLYLKTEKSNKKD